MASDERRNVEKTTSWFKVTLNGDRAAKLAEYLTKGKLVNVVGTETVGTYQAKDGTTQVSRDISASNIEFISVGNGQTAETTVTAEALLDSAISLCGNLSTLSLTVKFSKCLYFKPFSVPRPHFLDSRTTVSTCLGTIA